MIPDEFPDITPTNRYHQPRPKETFNAIADATLEPEGPKRQEMPTMQLRCELEIINTGEPAKCAWDSCISTTGLGVVCA